MPTPRNLKAAALFALVLAVGPALSVECLAYLDASGRVAEAQAFEAATARQLAATRGAPAARLVAGLRAQGFTVGVR